MVTEEERKAAKKLGRIVYWCDFMDKAPKVEDSSRALLLAIKSMFPHYDLAFRLSRYGSLLTRADDYQTVKTCVEAFLANSEDALELRENDIHDIETFAFDLLVTEQEACDEFTWAGQPHHSVRMIDSQLWVVRVPENFDEDLIKVEKIEVSE